MFSAFIVWYLFLAGTGSGAFCFTVLSSIGSEQDTPGAKERIRRVTGFSVSALCMAVASLFLLLDFQSPLVVWRAFLNPLASWASFGACVVALFTALTIATALLSVMLPRIPSWAFWVIRIAGTLFALATMVYAGLLLSSMVAIDVWSTWLLPLLFVVSSFSCGAAILLFMEVFFPGPEPLSNPDFWSAQPILGVVEAALLIIFILNRAGFSHTARDSIESLIMGDYASYFWLGVILVGLLLPLVIHAIYLKVPIAALVLAASIGVLIGGFLLRFCIVGIGLYTPVYPGS